MQISHHRSGSGEPLVLIHGVGHHWQGWLPALALITPHLETYACDSPGFGGSAPLAPDVAATIPNASNTAVTLHRFTPPG